MPCRSTGRGSPTSRSGRSGRCSPDSTSPCPARASPRRISAASCSTTSGRTTVRARPSSTTPSSATFPTGDPAPAAVGGSDQVLDRGARARAHLQSGALLAEGRVGTPWIPLTNEPEARSFMNYPVPGPGGQAAFFADFEFRFSDAELMFMRHAPERFVQHGNADWFDDHGFQSAAVLALLRSRARGPGPPAASGASFEFLEPVVVELKLTNVSQRPSVVDANVLAQLENLAVIIKRAGVRRPDSGRPMPATAWMAAAASWRRLAVRIAVDLGGPQRLGIAEPGIYDVFVVLHHGEEDIVSNACGPVRAAGEPRRGAHRPGTLLRGRGPGTRLRRHARDGGRDRHAGEVADQFADRRVAKHAQLALGNALAQPTSCSRSATTRTARGSSSRVPSPRRRRPT